METEPFKQRRGPLLWKQRPHNPRARISSGDGDAVDYGLELLGEKGFCSHRWTAGKATGPRSQDSGSGEKATW